MHDLDWAGQRVARAPGFAEAFDVLEVGGGNLERGIAVAAQYRDKRVCTSDYRLAPEAITRVDEARLANLRAEEVDVRAMPFRSGSFDFIFSVALMEHVAELEACLEEMHRVLRPGGIYYFIQAPFWSCAQGHHYKHWDDAAFAAIPLFGHLTLDEQQMRTALEQSQPNFSIDDCIDFIYHRDDLSRLTHNQTKAIVDASAFQVVSWEPYPDRRYDETAARAAFPELRYDIKFDELAICGAYVALRKPIHD